MEPQYIDTSYLAPFYLPEAHSDAVEKNLLRLPKGTALISQLVHAEFASLLSRKYRTKEISEAHARQAMKAFETHLLTGAIGLIPIQSEDFQQAIAWIMALRLPLRAPDVLHLAVAFRKNAIFWTLDRQLQRAAKAVGLDTRK